jgi:O-antigen ligase
MIRQRLVFDWQIWLLALTGVSSWIMAYDIRRATLALLLIIAGLIVYLIMANLPDPQQWHGTTRSALEAIFAGLPAAIAIYFLLTNDWSLWIGKLSVFDPILRVLAAWPLSLGGLSPNPNVIGGILAALLPLQVFALRHARRRVAVALIGLSLMTLLLTQTRGAWLALLLVAGMWLLWRILARRLTAMRRARWIWLGSVLAVGTVCAATLILTPLGEQLLGLGGDRRNLWQNSIDLIGDYPVTGIGLAGFEMAYSTYVLLVHVGHTFHAHNLWLDVWLNQGLLGVIALAGLIVNAVWPKPASRWRIAALSSLAVILLHGLVDDPFYGFGGIGLPIVIPLGLLVRQPEQAAAHSAYQRARWQPAAAIWALAVGAVVLAVLAPAGRALFEENWGAVIQTRAELSVYDWPAVPLQDVLRRSDVAGSAAAAQHYQRALALDPANAAAHRRLAQIELAHDQFESACRHLAAAYAGSPQQRATRQLLGECQALADRPYEAAALWRTVDLGQEQLAIRQYWYDEYLQDHASAEKLKLAARALASE